MKRMFLLWILPCLIIFAEPPVPLTPQSDELCERFIDGGTVSEGLRERLLYLAETLKDGKSGGEIKNFGRYVKLAESIPFVAKRNLKDPWLGDVTARAAAVPVTRDNPLGWVIEVDVPRFKALVEGRAGKVIGIEGNPLRLALHVGLMAAGEMDHYAQITELIEVDKDAFEQWAEKKHVNERPRPRPDKGKIEFEMEIRGDAFLLAGAGEGEVRVQAYKGVWDKISAEWKKAFRDSLVRKISSVAPILDIVIEYCSPDAQPLSFPVTVMDRLPDTNFAIKPMGDTTVGYFGVMLVKVKVWVETGERRVGRRIAKPIVGRPFPVTVFGVPNKEGLRQSYLNAITDFKNQFEGWRTQFLKNPPAMDGDTIIYIPSEAPAKLTNELYSRINYVQNRLELADQKPPVISSNMVDYQYNMSFHSESPVIYVLTDR